MSNLPPVAVDDVYTVAPNTAYMAYPLTNDYDPDGFLVGLISVAPSDQVNIVGADGLLFEGRAAGTYTYTYQINDVDNHTDEGTITLIVAPVGSPHVAVDDIYTFAPNVAFTINPLENDSDAEGPIGLVSAGPSSSFTIADNRLVFGSGLAEGTYNLFYTINDTDGNEDTATITIIIVFPPTSTPTPTLTPVGSPPNAVDDSYTFAANMPFSINPLENDSDPEDGTFVGLVSAGPSGSFTIVGGSLEFAAGLPEGTYTYFYTINDTDGNTDTANITITITHPPTATATVTSTPTPTVTPSQTFTPTITPTPDFNLGCPGPTAVDNGNALRYVIETVANSNGQDDTITLQTSCVYDVSGPGTTLDVLPDGGNSVTINGNGATISGGNAVRVIYVEY